MGRGIMAAAMDARAGPSRRPAQLRRRRPGRSGRLGLAARPGPPPAGARSGGAGRDRPAVGPRRTRRPDLPGGGLPRRHRPQPVRGGQPQAGVPRPALPAALPTIGYPPPWPLLLGGIYRLTYALHPDLALYNAAPIKLPAVVAPAVGLSYVAAAALHNLGATPAVVRRAWLALLFNPLIIFVSAAWGQIDAVVAVLALAALLLVAAGRRDVSAVVLALAVCVKPTAAPLLLAVLVYVGAASRHPEHCGMRWSSPAARSPSTCFPSWRSDGTAPPARVANAQFSWRAPCRTRRSPGCGTIRWCSRATGGSSACSGSRQ